jgi:hypothetical protein
MGPVGIGTKDHCAGEDQRKFSLAGRRAGSWKPVGCVWELQLKGANQRGQELLYTEIVDATLLKAATKQRLVKTVAD